MIRSLDAHFLRPIARPDLSGGFELRNLVPGNYLVTALEYVRDGEW